MIYVYVCLFLRKQKVTLELLNFSNKPFFVILRNCYKLQLYYRRIVSKSWSPETLIKLVLVESFDFYSMISLDIDYFS